MSKRLLIRADDLGFSEGVNYGIAKSVRDGIIRTVGIMPNMPDVRHGLDLLKGIDVCFGQHTNICVGRPITEPKLIPSICQENGEFKTSKEYQTAFKEGKDFVVLDEAILEIEAQYQRFVELTGRVPEYFECHAVSSDNFCKALEIVAKRHGLDYLPYDFGGNPVMFQHTKLYMSVDGMHGGDDPLENLKREASREYGEDECLMFVCHPGYLDDYILRKSSLTALRPKEVAMCIASETKQWIAENDIRVITYKDLV